MSERADGRAVTVGLQSRINRSYDDRPKSFSQYKTTYHVTTVVFVHWLARQCYSQLSPTSIIYSPVIASVKISRSVTSCRNVQHDAIDLVAECAPLADESLSTVTSYRLLTDQSFFFCKLTMITNQSNERFLKTSQVEIL